MTKFGSVLIQLASVDSTNNYAANLIEQGSCQDGSVIMADYQTNGRGQRGNSWQSVSSSNLLFTLAFRPKFALEEQIRCSWYVALIWQQCLRRFGIAAQIKWPNDLYVNGKKIGGMLIEQQLKGQHIDWCLVGCGFNVNEAPSNLNATALFTELGQKFKPITVLLEFLDLLNGQQALLNGDFAVLKAKYEAELYLKGVEHRFILPDGATLTGQIVGVDSKGFLKIETREETLSFDNQQIKFA
jgi:BirA family biotin operon repressor/biotin-[acetyl-CoA-carboxylase] ligase